jgi:hypothetical protein
VANLASGGMSWRALYPSRSGFEGGGVGSLPFSGRPRADSTVQLTGGRMEQSDGHSGVSLSRTSHNVGDGAVMAGVAAQG